MEGETNSLQSYDEYVYELLIQHSEEPLAAQRLFYLGGVYTTLKAAVTPHC